MTGRIILIGILKSTMILAAGVGSGILAYRTFADSGGTPKSVPLGIAAGLDGPGKVHALGSIQPRGGVFDVALPPGALTSRFGEWIDKKDDPIKKGDVIAILEGYDTRQREIDVIRAEIAAAEDAVKVEDRNERLAELEIDDEAREAREIGAMEQASLKLKVDALTEKHELSLKQFRDVDGLQLNNTISRQQYDQYVAQEKISRDELKYAQAEASRVSSELDLKTDSKRIEQKKQRVHVLASRAKGQIGLDTLRKKLDLAIATRDQCRVLAPIDGTVLDVCTKVGESGAGKPLVKVGDTSRMYVLAEIYEDDRRLVAVGQKVEVRGRGLPGRGAEAIPGTVERISSIIGAHKQSPLDPTWKDNARVFPAWIALDPAGKVDLTKLILMPVDVTILVDGGAPVGK